MDASKPGLKVLVYDRTCRGGRGGVGLSHAWEAGARLYRGLGRLDATFGAASWAEALTWLVEVGEGERLSEVQYWGHGTWGQARIAGDVLDSGALAPTSSNRGILDVIGERLGVEGLWWFRTCETFGAHLGHNFASAFADVLGCRVAGHTYIIGFHQSGLHSLRPGVVPAWSAAEGLRRGTPEAPEAARLSRPWAPHTITCLHGAIPLGY
ncbi:MAG: hypothetical protein KAI47_15520 [Deltaproteobacteria bacterium]|nr:hypothetical protein [Deltaproteobacteria bacterium]